MSSPSNQSGHSYRGNHVSGSARVHLGDTYFEDQTINALGLAIYSTAAKGADYTGQYSHGSLRPAKTYVSRPKLQQQLVAQLHDTTGQEDEARRLVVVCGIGGAGKSQLVLNYVREYRQDYAAVFWIEAGQRETLERDFLEIYRVFFHDQPGSQDNVKVDDVVLAVKSWFSGRSRRWLLVFDNADTINNKEDEAYVDIEHFLPNDPSVDVIITTRSASAEEMTDLKAVQVAEMELTEATELFMKYAQIKEATPAIIAEIELIVKELGELALAITLAGSYVSVTPRLRSNIRLYLPEYRQRRKELLSQKPKRLVHQYGESVLTTWETTFSAVISESVVASRFLTLLAFVHYDDIYIKLFDQPTSSHDNGSQGDAATPKIMWMLQMSPEAPVNSSIVEAAFRCLETYALVQWKEDQESFSMHKLVHAWVHDRIDDENVRFGYSVAALDLLTNAIDKCGPRVTEKLRLAPHLLANFEIVSELNVTGEVEDDLILRLVEIVSAFFKTLGRWADERAIEKFILDGQSRRRGKEHPDTITAMSNLAVTLGNLGQLEEASLMQQEAVEKGKRILGEEHPQTITAMSNLAVTLGDLGQLEEAASMQKEVVEKGKRILAEEHPQTITAMSNLAVTLGNLGRLEEAASMQKEVVERRRRILGEQHPDTIRAMNKLANTLGELGQLEEAASIEREVVEKMKRILGEEHPDTIQAMSNFAVTLRTLGFIEEAASMQQEAVEKGKRILGEEHPQTITAMSNLAVTLGDLGQLEEGASMQKEVVERRRRILGEQHPDTITAMGNLAITLGDLGQLEDAASMQQEVVEKMKRVLGEEHPRSIAAMSNLAVTLGDLGYLEKAVSIQQEVVEKRKRILGQEHPRTITAMSNLAVTLGNLGFVEEAASLEQEVLEERRRTLGEEHPDTITAMSNLANTLGQIGQLNEAASMKRVVLEKRTRTLGEEHPDTISAMSNLANTLERLGQLVEASSMKQEVLEKMRRVLGEQHPLTVTAMNNLAITFSQAGQLREALLLMERVVEKRKEILGDRHPDTIMAMNNLVIILKEFGKLDEAFSLMQEVVEKQTHILGEEHQETISATQDLALILQQLGRLDEAILMQEEVLQKRERVLGKEHPDTISAKNHLTGTQYQLEQLNEGLWMRDEVASVLSDGPGLTTASTLSSTGINVDAETAEEFAESLFADRGLNQLFCLARDKAGLDRFERNLARLLVKYSNDLRREAQTALEVVAAKLVRQKAQRVANYLTRKLDPHEARIKAEMDRLLSQDLDTDRVENFVARTLTDDGKYGNIRTVKEQDDQGNEGKFRNWPSSDKLDADDSDDDSPQNSDSDNEVEVSESNILSAFEPVRNFMLNSEALSQLRKNLQNFVFAKAEPKGAQAWKLTDLRVTPSHLVPVPSFSDRLKLALETIFGQPLLWSPLEQPLRACPDSAIRISWRCECGSVLYFDIPREDHNAEDVPDESGQEGRQRSGGPIIPLHNTSRPSRSTGNASNSGQGQGQVAGGYSSGQRFSSMNDGEAIEQRVPNSQSTTTQSLVHHQSFIHWCVDEGKSTTRLKNLDVGEVRNSGFAQSLLIQYYSICNWQSWLTMTDCAGARVKKFRIIVDNEDIVACGAEDFPRDDNADYDYESLEPPDHFKCFLEAEIRHHLAHRHYTPNATKHILQHIPKKKSLRLSSRYGTEGYGLHAFAEVAIWRVLVVTLVSQIGSVVFAAWWLVRHPGDLQNACMPATISLALLAIYRPASRQSR